MIKRKIHTRLYVFYTAVLAFILWCIIGCGSTSVKFDTQGTKITTPKTGLEYKMSKWGNK